MARHSFIQIEKISDVKGRINYISSPARQEYLYAAMNTTDRMFWINLSRESQQEFLKSGTGGTCIEARELIIALPEVYTSYEPEQVLRLFTHDFQKRHGMECVSALHHNKRKTNYHIHLIFSERRLLQEPELKVASRNMFYNEQGKHVRTKKEILDQNGTVRTGCKIVAKGEVYEQRNFTNKEPYFKSEVFLEEEKKQYTALINRHIKNPHEKLTVFEKNSIYLPTKKVGKNNPKALEIESDNDVRRQWNLSVDMALIEGVPETEIRKVKETEISQRVQKSIKEHGRKPGLFRGIVLLAKKVLEQIMQKLKIPPRPQLKVDIQEFRQMQDLYIKLVQQTKAIQKIEQEELPQLKEKLGQLGGMFKKKERQAVMERIADAEVRASNVKSRFHLLLSQGGYETAQDFMNIYRESEQLVTQYQQELERWNRQTGVVPLSKAGIHEQIRNYREQVKVVHKKSIKHLERGAR